MQTRAAAERHVYSGLSTRGLGPLALLTRTLEKELQCVVCLEIFDKPCTLGCGHTYCRLCVDQIWELRPDLAIAHCPTCRVPFRRGKDPIPINPILDQLSIAFRPLARPNVDLASDLTPASKGSEKDTLRWSQVTPSRTTPQGDSRRVPSEQTGEVDQVPLSTGHSSVPPAPRGKRKRVEDCDDASVEAATPLFSPIPCKSPPSTVGRAPPTKRGPASSSGKKSRAAVGGNGKKNSTVISSKKKTPSVPHKTAQSPPRPGTPDLNEGVALSTGKARTGTGSSSHKKKSKRKSQ